MKKICASPIISVFTHKKFQEKIVDAAKYHNKNNVIHFA
jgi:hypothetical protein